MKTPIQLFFFIISALSFSQTMYYNNKNGYSIQEYDVVSYFDEMPLEGKNSFLQLLMESGSSLVTPKI